jgi:hypothetical protein
MQKLGLATIERVETENYDRYLATFNDGLSKDQARLIQDMLGSAVVPVVTDDQVLGELV